MPRGVRHVALGATAVACVALLVHGCLSKHAESGQPAETEPPTIVYDRYSGWFGRSDSLNDLQIWPDGAIRTEEPMHRHEGRAATGRMTREELRDLVAYLLDDLKLRRFTKAAIDSQRAAITREANLIVMTADAGGERIIIRTDDGEVLDLYCHDARGYRHSYREIAEYVHFFEATQRLDAIRARVIIGPGLYRYLELVNRRLQKEHPGVAPFVWQDLRFARRPVDQNTLMFDLASEDLVHPDTVRWVSARVIDRRWHGPSIEVTTARRARGLSVLEQSRLRRNQR